MVDRANRDRLILLIHSLRNQRMGAEAFSRHAEMRTEDRAIASIAEEVHDLFTSPFPLPSNASDTFGANSFESQTRIDRAILYLKSDCEWPAPSWVERFFYLAWYVFLGLMVLGLIISAVCAGVLGPRVGVKVPSWLYAVFVTPVFIFVAMLFIGHFLAMLGGAIRVFRVRVLRRDLTPEIADDPWPFETRAALQNAEQRFGVPASAASSQ